MRPWPSRRDGFWVALTVTAAICAAVASIFAASGLRGWFGGGLAVLMFAIAIYDARHFIIPNELVGLAFVLALISAGASQPDAAISEIGLASLRAAVSGGTLLAVKIVYRWLRGREGLGMGDIKLAAVAGAWLDWLIILLAIDIAVVAALAGYIIHQYSRDRRLRAFDRLPFGMYLAPAIWCGWLLEATFFGR